MSRVDEMREVVNKLADNHAARRSSLDALRRNVREQRAGAADAVNEMAAERAVMSVELHTGLAADLLGLRHEVRTTLDDFLAERHDMAADLKQQLDATREQREAQVAALRTEARQFVGNVAADRQVMAEDLFGMLSDAQLVLSSGVRTLLGDFTTQRATMSQAQADSLAANGVERRSQVSAMIADIQALLAEIDADNNATAAELRAALSSDNRTRSAATADFMAAVAANRRNMAEALANRLDAFVGTLEAQVSSSLGGFAAERADLQRSLAEMAQVWREFAAAMQGSPVAPPPEPAPPEPPAVKPPAEDMNDRLLAYLAQHPDGAKLVDLEPEFEIGRPQLGRYLRGLVDSGKVVKDPETLIYKLA
jgi:hypothetical protein